MPTPAGHGRIIRRRGRGKRSLLQSHSTRGAARLASSNQLMAPGGGLLLPRLDGIPLFHRLVADDSRAVVLAESLVELGIAIPEDWKRAECDPTSFIRITLERWIDAHGGAAIRRRFVLGATLGSSACAWADEDEADPQRLFLTIEPSEAGCIVFGPTMTLLESCHPNLPATFFHLLVGALNRWIRVYDYRDAEERAETLQEWIAQEPDAEQYELPDVAKSIPPCMRLTALDEGELAHARDRIDDPRASKLVEAALALDHLSTQAERPELGEDIGQLLSDCNPPLPSALAVFAESDAIAACFDDEAQAMMELTPEPNLIIPFDPGIPGNVRDAFHAFGVACETIAAASRLVDLMPGNDGWVISG
jgi:hypothetical protein